MSAIAAGNIQYPPNLANASAFGAAASLAADFCASLVLMALPAIFLTIFCAMAKPVPYCVSNDVNLASVPASPS